MDKIEQAVRRLYASQEHRPSCEAVLRAIREARALPDSRPGVVGFKGPRTDFVKTKAATVERLERCTAHRSFNGCDLGAGYSGKHKSGGLTWEGPV